MKFIDLEQGSPDWLDFRKGKIGASDAPSIMGFGYKTPYQLWKEKLCIQEPEPENAAMRHGKDNEEKARRMLNELCFGRGLPFVPAVVIHDEVPWAFASLDGHYITDNKIFICEIKCGFSSKIHDKIFKGEIDKNYIVQMHHQMWVTGAQGCLFASYYKGELLSSWCPRDQSLIDEMIEKEKEFMQSIINLDPPPLQKGDYEVRNDEEFRRAMERYHLAKLKEKEIADEKELAKQELLKLSNGKPIDGFGCKVYEIVKKGNIDYSLIPQLQGLNLEHFRRPSSPYWQITGKFETGA